jgi:hypothetical protein
MAFRLMSAGGQITGGRKSTAAAKLAPVKRCRGALPVEKWSKT